MTTIEQCNLVPKPNTDLICSKFEGYKLSMQNISNISVNVQDGIDYAIYEDNNYAYLYVRLFAFHNNLYNDPWNYEKSVYYINKNWDIIKTEIDDRVSKTGVIYSVWTIPGVNQRSVNRYNISLVFATAELAILCNGQNTIYVLTTGFRNTSGSEKWKLIDEFRFGKEGRRFKLCDSLIQDNTLLVVLQSIEETDVVERDDKISKNLTALFILSFSLQGKRWIINSTQKITTKAAIDSLCLVSHSRSLLIASDESVNICKKVEKNEVKYFTNTDAFEIGESTIVNDQVEENNHPSENKLSYRWWQTDETVKAWFTLPRNVNKEDIEVRVCQSSIRIDMNKTQLLTGSLQYVVHEEAISWLINKFRFLELNLKKIESGIKWSKFINEDEISEEIHQLETIEPGMSNRVRFCEEEDISGMRNFSVDEPMEECDYATSKDLKLYTVNTLNGTIDKEVYIGRRKLLCTGLHERPNSNWTICTEYDVDGFVWQISPECRCEHVGIFNAFAYILASKQSKFVTFNADMTYVVITEAKKRAYVYTHAKFSRNHANAIDGKQYIIDLGTEETILGINAANDILYLLTDSTLHCYLIEDILPRQL